MTVTSAASDRVPSATLVATTLAVPGAAAVTKPDWSTVATDSSEEDQMTLVSAPPTVSTVGMAWAVSPTSSA